MTEWNNDRLDEFRKGVDQGFANVDKRFDKVDKRFDKIDERLEDGFGEVREEFRRVDHRLDGLHHLLIRMAWSYGIGMLAFAGALLGLIAAKF